MSAGFWLVPIHFGAHGDLLGRLAREIEGTFGVAVKERPPWFDPGASFDASRGQYCSTAILAQLLEGAPDGESRLLGVTSVDLFIPVLTYVFGEAQLAGRAAVVSIHRLRSEIYGLPPNEDLLHERLVKEAVHEIGHTYGLVHCHDPDCVMRASTYAEDVDLKSARFCASCRGAVNAPGRAGGGERPCGAEHHLPPLVVDRVQLGREDVAVGRGAIGAAPPS
jgi:archaemetzincin